MKIWGCEGWWGSWLLARRQGDGCCV